MGCDANSVTFWKGKCTEAADRRAVSRGWGQGGTCRRGAWHAQGRASTLPDVGVDVRTTAHPSTPMEHAPPPPPGQNPCLLWVLGDDDASAGDVLTVEEVGLEGNWRGRPHGKSPCLLSVLPGT